MPASPIGVLVQANVPGEAVESGPSIWIPGTALTFGGMRGSEPAGRKSVPHPHPALSAFPVHTYMFLKQRGFAGHAVVFMGEGTDLRK